MQRHIIRSAVAGLFIGLASLAASAQTIDFEGVTGLYFGGDTYMQSGFTMTQVGDYATIDTSAQFDASIVGPTGNETSFYSAFNDTAVMLASDTSSLFSLTGFDAGFIAPPQLEEGLIAGQLVVSAIGSGGQAIVQGFDFGTSSASGSFSFLTFSSPADFSAFSSIRSAIFSACLYVDNGCARPFQNLGQFAVDNIHAVLVAAPVPEPETYALMLLGIAALAYRRRQTR